MARRCSILAMVVAALALVVTSCSSTRHVPDGQYLLNSMKIRVEGDKDVSTKSLANYVRQTPNHKVLGFAKLSLGVYNLSGNDSTKWYNRWLRSLGQEPVIFDAELAEQSRRQLNLALVNRGYNHATVTIDTLAHPDKKKIDLVYNIVTGPAHTIETVDYQFDDPALGEFIMRDSASFTIAPGSKLNRDLLENERTLITSRLRDNGYFTFNKDFITFVADTTENSTGVGLTMHVHAPEPSNANPAAIHRRYIVKHVTYIVESPDNTSETKPDTIGRPGFSFIYGDDRYLRPSLLEEKCFIRPGEPYSASDVSRTYEALSQLAIVKFVNISMAPVAADSPDLDAFITISRTKKQGVTFEVEGTNSEGDLGFGLGLTYQHRDLAKSAEVLTAKFRGSYESLSGNLDGFINNRYTEFAGEVGIAFPKMKVPFLSRNFKRRARGATEFALSMNYQERPEYTRVISGASWKYRWNNPQATWRHTLDLLDLNFVYLPNSTIDFINTVAPTNPLLRYSYEDHFIMRVGYTFYRTNRRNVATNRLAPAPFQSRIWTFRFSGETAGNLLYALSNAFGQHRRDGAYKLFGVQYAQYVKGELNYTYLLNCNTRNSFAFHAGFGIGYPYGNSRMIPFEKRFYAGGANSVRGWGVRTLGPGAYDARNSVIDFINQCGDISLILSAEYRAKIFWVIEGALFVDAGNIWTIRSYENQPDGMFRFNDFYKQIALAYGAGIRLDFTYFLVRFDLGMKAHNPARGQEPWPLIHPNWHRDHTFHLSIGYPF